MDELEKLRKHWEDDNFQRKHALAREIVVNRLRELNREYEEKTGQGFVRFIETRMKTPESIAEKLQRKDYDVDFDTAVTALNDISGIRCICYSVKEIYWIARQIGKTVSFASLYSSCACFSFIVNGFSQSTCLPCSRQSLQFS